MGSPTKWTFNENKGASNELDANVSFQTSRRTDSDVEGTTEDGGKCNYSICFHFQELQIYLMLFYIIKSFNIKSCNIGILNISPAKRIFLKVRVS